MSASFVNKCLKTSNKHVLWWFSMDIEHLLDINFALNYSYLKSSFKNDIFSDLKLISVSSSNKINSMLSRLVVKPVFTGISVKPLGSHSIVEINKISTWMKFCILWEKGHIIKLLLTELGRSVRENLDLGRVQTERNSDLGQDSPVQTSRSVNKT